MGLATIDPHSQKEHTEIHKIPKFGINWHKWNSEVWELEASDALDNERVVTYAKEQI